MRTVLQAGAIVVREEGGIQCVLLVRSKKDPGVWVFPKGHIEAGEPPSITALREAFEEAGVAGLVLGSAGPALTFRFGDDLVGVDYFLVQLTAEMPSPEGRDKLWLPEAEALERLSFQNARDLLRGALGKLQNCRIAELQEIRG
jgi:8-oxo-dGTP pyrophosphatase MutT (NUDIX family)